ncbi:MAG: TonB family protein [Bacteroidetes bacterium]|jgi:protein TonB|nr:TonB family protein [Bacteroidota bacterium]
MITSTNSDQSFNELLFENRNKEYGAYAIRSGYNETVTRSLGITTLAVSVLVCLVFYLSNGKSKSKLDIEAFIEPQISICTIEMPKPEPLPEPKYNTEKVKDPLPPKTDNLNLVVTNEKVDKSVKPVELMNVGAKQVDKGSDSSATYIPPVNTEPPVDPNKVEYNVSEMPEFNGDIYTFIKKNLRYPEAAKENFTQGTVGLAFVIEKDGSVGDVKVLGGVADGCTEEAIRVVKMMPRWKPGKNHGELVRVSYTLPIKFRLK